MQGQPAPAAADIEHALVPVKLQFAGDMVLLAELGFIKADPRFIEIGAGILPVLIQKKSIEIVAEIIVMMHIAARLPWCPAFGET